ncbi:MAG: GNAT family N-acetyltransferase [Clostridiaceae bacterium]|nr:GNAT family N-acetyltransferase [Clostridiaceae bacterium]
MNWKLKRFNELKLEELYKILQERINVFVVEQNCPYPECDAKDYSAIHLFAEEDENVVAYLRILPPEISYKEASIGRVLVNNQHRRKDLGSDLMKKAIDYMHKEWNEDTIRISAQEYLLDFYGDLGFKSVSETYLEDGIPHVEMLYVGK